MRRRGFVAFAFLVLLAGTCKAKDERNVGKVVADVARALGAANLKTIQYSGTSGYTYTFGGQCNAFDPWPRYTILTYTRLLDYEKGASMEDASWTQDYTRPPCGAGYQPLIGAIHEKTFLSGMYAWSFGGPTRSADLPPTPAAGAVEQRQLQMALTPYGWVKAAMAASPTLESKTVDGKPTTVVSFTWNGKYKMNGYVNSENLLDRVETWINSDILGDMALETTYSDYKDFSGVKFPMKIVQSEGGFPMLEVNVSDVQPNAPDNIQVPDGIQSRWQATPPPLRIQTAKVANGVWALMAGTQTAVVEFKDFLALYEAPTGEERSLAAIAEAKRLVPNKPIRYIINSHHHLDHAGGLRTYVAEGSTIVTQAMNVPYYEQVFKLPHTLKPDLLSKNPKQATYLAVGQKAEITDGDRTLEIHLLQDQIHSPDMLVAYLPKERILIQCDDFNVFPEPETGPITLMHLKQNLVDNIQRLGLDVQQIITMHNGNSPGAVPIAELYRQIREVGP